MVLRNQVSGIIFGTVFVFIGMAAIGIAGLRRWSGVRVLIWLGIWSAMYGAIPLVDSLAAVSLLPHWFLVSVPYLDTVITYLILPVASLAFLELSLGKLRFFLQAVIFASLGIALAGIGLFIFTGSNDKLIPYNHLLATCSLAVLLAVVAVPKIARKLLVLPNRGVLAVGTLVFAVEAFYVNLARPLGYRTPSLLDDLGFAVLLWSLGYVAVKMVFANERRLRSIENELATAREIQASTLPSSVPEINNLRIAAAYRPMTAVAGDFYDFLPSDASRVGFLVADVSGHGVPAALIAAMVKVAMLSAVSFAQDPRAVLRALNRTLSPQLRGHFVSAAYLWLDTENGKALYSAAGHPPLLRWRDGKLDQIESNGVVLGVAPDPEYPVYEMRISPGDRLLLCTDGVLEPENASGDFFGDQRLEQVVRNNQSRPPAELLDQLFSEISHWRPPSATQQDDITLIVIDVI